MPVDPRIAPVLRAQARERRAVEETRRSFVRAHEQGMSYAEIARAVGVSRQAVRQLVERQSNPKETQ